jgi:hypothetical protein
MCGRTLARKDGKSMKGLIVSSLLPIPFGGSSKEFTSWLFLREVSWHPGWNNLRANGLQQANVTADCYRR